MSEQIASEEEPDIEASFLWFASEVLGLNPYDWQNDVLSWFDTLSIEMVLGTIASPNGAGKSGVIIPSLVLGLLFFYPRAKVVLTTADGKQLDGQVMPALNEHKAKFPEWTFIEREIRTPTGGRFIGFTTDQSGRAEGWHKYNDEEGPLLIIVDEAKSVPDDIFQAIHRCTYNGLLLTSSPGKMSGQFYDSQFKPSLGFNALQVGLKDCPHITQDKIDRILSMYGPNSPYTRSTLHGEFIEIFNGDPVYYAYNQQYHERDSLGWPNGATLVVGMDGGTHNASVIMAVKEDSQKRTHVWVMREIILTGSDTDRQAVKLLQVLAEEFPFWNSNSPVCPQTLFFCDPALRNSAYTSRGPNSSALKVLQSHGIYPGYKVGLGLQPSIATVNRVLQQHHMVEVIDFKTGEKTLKAVWHFQIDAKRCPVLADAMRGRYRYPELGAPGYGSDAPMKGDSVSHCDHVCFVVGTPILTAGGEYAIETIKTGDFVFTRKGIRRVSAIGVRNAITKEYRLSDGRLMRCTPDHPFWSRSENRMKKVEYWTYCDTVFECNRAQKLLSGMGKLIAGILILKGEATEFISNATRNICTMLFGSFITAKERKGRTFITKMAIPEIIPLAISNASHPSNTSAEFTPRRKGEQHSLSGAMLSGHSQKLGTHQQRVVNGTRSMPLKKDLESSSNASATATIVGRGISSPERPESKPLRASVQTHANQPIEENPAWTMWIKFVQAAAKFSGTINTTKLAPVRVHAVESSEERAQVFNISVEGEHEYFANGILVSNCDAGRYGICNILDIAQEAHQGGMKSNYPALENPEKSRTI